MGRLSVLSRSLAWYWDWIGILSYSEATIPITLRLKSFHNKFHRTLQPRQPPFALPAKANSQHGSNLALYVIVDVPSSSSIRPSRVPHQELLLLFTLWIRRVLVFTSPVSAFQKPKSNLRGKYWNSHDNGGQRLVGSTEGLIVFGHHLSGLSLGVVSELAGVFETDISQHHPRSRGRREAACLEGETNSDGLREGCDGMAIRVPEGDCFPW